MSFRADLLANAADNQEPFTIVVHNLRSPCEWGFGRSFRAKRLTANVFVDGLSLITNQWLPATGVHQCEWLWPIWLRKTRIFPQKIKDYKKQKQRKAQFSDDAWLLFIFELFPLFSVLKSPNCVVLLIRSKSTTIFIREMYNNSVFVSIFGGKRNYFWHHSHRADCSYSTTVTKNRPSQTHVHLHSGYFPNIPLPRNEWTSHWILMNFMANQWRTKTKQNLLRRLLKINHLHPQRTIPISAITVKRGEICIVGAKISFCWLLLLLLFLQRTDSGVLPSWPWRSEVLFSLAKCAAACKVPWKSDFSIATGLRTNEPTPVLVVLRCKIIAADKETC